MTQVRIRMYRPNGIGDFFLLSFSEGEQTRHMLIDCGVLKGTDEGTARMRQLVRKICEETKGQLDILVATHEHWDHISGFNQAREEFEHFKVNEVWLGWPEKKTDPRAAELAKKREKAQNAVEAASLKLAMSGTQNANKRLISLEGLRQFNGFFGANATSRTSTSSAMEWVRSGTGAEVRYLEPGSSPLTVAGIEGIRIFVLGPPFEAAAIRRSDPSERTPEVYHLAGETELGFFAALDKVDGRDSGCPFDPSFCISVEIAEQNRFFQQTYFLDHDWREIDLDWLGSAERLALQLDSDTNNTSLVLAIELVASKRVLLFPGDAQVGNWLSWQALQWTYQDDQNRPIIVTGPELLQRTVLYKVGHHASHNATMREKGLEQMVSSELSALIPVYEEQAHSQGKKGWEMPFQPLLTRLVEKTSGRVFRADMGTPEGFPRIIDGKYKETDDYIELTYSD